MSEEGIDAEEFNMACFKLSRSLQQIAFCVPETVPLVRLLLRTAGRVVIDTGGEGADPAAWTGTEEMTLRWLDDAVRPLGYRIVPIEGGGRAELAPESASWS